MNGTVGTDGVREEGNTKTSSRPSGFYAWCGTKQVGGTDGTGSVDVERWAVDEQWRKIKAASVRGVGQLEEGSHKHIQFYCVFRSRKRLETLKNQLGRDIHWEPRKGSEEVRTANPRARRRAPHIVEPNRAAGSYRIVCDTALRMIRVSGPVMHGAESGSTTLHRRVRSCATRLRTSTAGRVRYSRRRNSATHATQKPGMWSISGVRMDRWEKQEWPLR